VLGAELRGELVVVGTRIDRLDGKLDSVEGRLDGKLDSVEGRLDGKIDRVAGRLDAKIDRVAGELKMQISEAKDSLRVWFVGTLLAVVALSVGIASLAH
jgi:hypothetical protein